MPFAKKKSTDRFGSRKGSKRKQLQQAREARAKRRENPTTDAGEVLVPLPVEDKGIVQVGETTSASDEVMLSFDVSIIWYGYLVIILCLRDLYGHNVPHILTWFCEGVIDAQAKGRSTLTAPSLHWQYAKWPCHWSSLTINIVR